MTGSTTSAGTKLAISAALPATDDAAGYTALVLTNIGRVESVPAFGPTSDPVTFQPLDGPEETHKGAVKYGSLQVPHAIDKTDAGQNLMRLAGAPGNNALYSFCATYPDGSKDYFQARVLGNPKEVGGANNILKGTSTIAICTKVVEVPPA